MDVVLINNSTCRTPLEYQGMAVVNQALIEKNITPKVYSINDFSIDMLKERSIVALGAYYQELDQFIELSKQLQKAGHYVALGGHGAYDPKTNYNLLKDEHFNAINRGHVGPFVNLASKVSKNNFDNSTLDKIAHEEGLGTKEHPFTKLGAFPDINKFPLVDYISYGMHSSSGIVIPSIRTCENYCDFCSEHLLKTPDITDMIIDSLREYEKNNVITNIDFTNPTFNDANIADIQKILSSITSVPKIGIYLDSCQLGDERKLELLDEFNVTSAYIGLNAINNLSAAYIGRREKGKIRENIEQEKENMLKFFARERKVEGQEKYLVSIMNSKADEQDEIFSLFDFIADVYTVVHNNPKKSVEINLIQTIPLPRTRFFQLHSNDYKLETYSSYKLGENYNPKILNYDSKGNDFLSRTTIPRYHFAKGTKHGMIVGLQTLLFAYEYVYKGEISHYLNPAPEYKQRYENDIKFIKDPSLHDEKNDLTLVESDGD